MSSGIPKNAQRVLAGRLGAHVQHSRHDPVKTTEAARFAFMGHFEAEVDPGGQLPAAERAKRAEAAKKAHFLRMAMKSAQVRRANAERRNGGQET